MLEHCERVLKSRGKLILHEICLGQNSSFQYPVIWANNASLNFLKSPNELNQLLVNSGYKELIWMNNSAASIKWYHTMKNTRKSKPTLMSGLNLVIGPDFAKKGANIQLNLENGRINVFQGVFERIK